MTLNQESKKVIVITGASAGIGRAAAKTLAAQGHTLIIVGRNPEKTRHTVAHIQADTGSNRVEGLLADFSDLDQVRSLAKGIQERYSRLDVLVNNAGTYFRDRIRTPYGMEMTLVVNHLAPFLLTNLLLDNLKASKAGRIVNVSSSSHLSVKDTFKDLNYQAFYFGLSAYKRSKLANVLFTYELDRRLAETGITVNVLHPGLVRTEIFKSGFRLVDPILHWFVNRKGLSPEQGADTLVYLAASPEVAAVSGKYFVRRRAVPSSQLSYDIDLARRLWETSEQAAGLTR